MVIENEKEWVDVTKYEHPSLTADIVIFTIQNGSLKLLLIKRKSSPFKNSYALPGGFVRMNETLDDAAKRELEEETGVKDVYLEQLYTFGDVRRDPRTRVVTIAYMALVDSERLKIRAASDASDVGWFDVDSLPPLAFDHDKIISYAIERLRSKLSYSNIAFSLLPKYFTLTQVQRIYEIILGHEIDKRNFRKKLFSLGIVKETDKMLEGVAHRPARLYELSGKKFELRVFD
jgi:8-oxo-dGTP diphosphatase